MSLRRLLAIITSVALILGATLVSFGGESTVRSVRWCFACGEFWLADAIVNVLLFVPLGVAVTRSATPVLPALMTGMLLSLGVETLQWLGIPPGRSPALPDVVTNTCGALVGHALARNASLLLLPGRHAAALLATVWGVIAAAVMFATSVALEPLLNDHATTNTRVQASPYDYSPAFGWYGGRVSHAVIEGDSIGHGGSGPVVRVLASAQSSLRANVQLVALDPAHSVRSFLYVHLPGDSLPLIMMGQHDGDAVLYSARRGSRWGLHIPRVKLASALSGVPVAKSAAQGDTAELTGIASTRGLLLTAAGADTARIAFSPLLGWALVQSVLRPSETLSLLAQLAWLSLLVLPLCYWASRHSLLAGAAAACLVPSAAALIAVTSGRALPTISDVIITLALAAFAMAAGRRTISIDRLRPSWATE